MDDPTARLSEQEHRRKEQLLTQHHAAHISAEGAVVLKHGELFMLATEAGDVPWELPHAFGLFDRDSRYLDGLQMTVNGSPMVALTADDVRGYRTRHYLTNPELECESGTLERNTIEITRDRVIRSDTLYEMITVHNYGARAAPLNLQLRFRACFEDLFILKKFMDGPRGRIRAPEVVAGNRVYLSYDGIDGMLRSTTLAFDPAPQHLTGEHVEFAFTLAVGRQWRVAITVRPCLQAPDAPREPLARPRDPDLLMRMLQRSHGRWIDTIARVTTSHETFDRVFARSVEDLGLLRSRLDGLHYFAAGVPWFVTLFGRDAAIVGLQTMPFGCRTAGESARLLARYQAQKVDAYRDAEPGKILHELRRGELSRANEIPQQPAYYGTVDATLLFLQLVAGYVAWSDDLALAEELKPNIDAALGWIDRDGDHDGDGYLDYVGRYGKGLINQGWKDAGNSIVRADGSLPEPPIAPVEVQGYLYRAWRDTAQLLRRLGDDRRAAELEERAAELQQRFERDFWSDELQCYVVARENGGRTVASVTSNAGHVLATGIASDEHARAVAQRLFKPDMYSGWGIRTLSADNPAYNPMGYHLGSVWPHDNAFIIAGLTRYRLFAPALQLLGDLFDVASNLHAFRLPELFCGHPRERAQAKPVPYPVACAPQSWAAGSLLHALTSVLGLHADAPAKRLQVVRPQLPGWIERLSLSGVTLGASVIDLAFENTHGTTTVAADVREGEATVETIGVEDGR